MGDISKGDGRAWKREVGKGRDLGDHAAAAFLIYLGFDEVIIDDLSFFREPSMPFYAPSYTKVRSHRGKQMNEGGQFLVPCIHKLL